MKPISLPSFRRKNTLFFITDHYKVNKRYDSNFHFIKEVIALLLSCMKRYRSLIYKELLVYMYPNCKSNVCSFPLFKVFSFTEKTRSLEFSPILLTQFLSVKMISQKEWNLCLLVKNVHDLFTSLIWIILSNKKTYKGLTTQ